MKDATHFIELFKTDEGLLIYEQMSQMSNLKWHLRLTKQLKYKTIAIWKIKPKKTMYQVK
jgi:hypothetical protein